MDYFLLTLMIILIIGSGLTIVTLLLLCHERWQWEQLLDFLTAKLRARQSIEAGRNAIV
jgi:hypothetical protein